MLDTLPPSFRQFPSIAKSFVHGDGLPLQHVLSETLLQRIADEESVSFGSTFTVSLVL